MRIPDVTQGDLLQELSEDGPGETLLGNSAKKYKTYKHLILYA